MIALLSKEHEFAEYNLSSKMSSLHQRYSQFKIQYDKQSLPSLESFSSWKGYQIKFFFNYIILSLFQNILPNQYHEDLQLLVLGIKLLSQRSVSNADIQLAQNCFNTFHLNICIKWGAQPAFINFHDIVHLPAQVKKTGPLWVYSGFFAEAALGYYVNLALNGTNPSASIQFALSCRYTTRKMMQSLSIVIPENVQSYLRKLNMASIVQVCSCLNIYILTSFQRLMGEF